MSRTKRSPVVVGWLDNCPSCGHEKAIVNTEGDQHTLFYGEQVTCMKCGKCGEIDCDDDAAFVVWDEV